MGRNINLTLISLDVEKNLLLQLEDDYILMDVSVFLCDMYKNVKAKDFSYY